MNKDINSGQLFSREILARYRHICTLLHERGKSFCLEDYGSIYGWEMCKERVTSVYSFQLVDVDAYELLVELDLKDSSVSLEDFAMFNVLNIGFVGEDAPTISMSLADEVDNFTIKTFFAYAIALYSKNGKSSSWPCLEILRKLQAVCKARPLLLAKLFVEDSSKFMDAIAFSKSESLANAISRNFNENTSLDPKMFGKILEIFNEKMSCLHSTSMYMN